MRNWGVATNDTGPTALSAHRVERAVYLATNERGATVRIGGSDEEGAFSPGELLQIAAAACAALSADHALRSRLGDDFDASFSVQAQSEQGQRRYTHFETSFVVDMSELPQERHGALIQRAQGVIERRCAVARTLHHGATTEVNLTPDGAAEGNR